MKRTTLYGSTLLLVVLGAGGALADDWSASSTGAGGQGFGAIRTASGQVQYDLITNGIGVPTGAQILQGATVVLDLTPIFNFGSASGSKTGTLADGTYSLRVSGPGGVLTGTLTKAATGDGGGGGGGGDGLVDDTSDPCVANDQTLCLNGDRFALTMSFSLQTGSSGEAKAVELTNDTGYFYYTNPSNVEVVIKVLDACSINERFWVFAGGLTNQNVSIKVRDSQAGKSRIYTNPASTPFEPLQDTTQGFPFCP